MRLNGCLNGDQKRYLEQEVAEYLQKEGVAASVAIASWPVALFVLD
jgi:hypothetical protein